MAENWNNKKTAENKEKEEITLKFGKGLVKPFQGKDGTEWAKVLVPNTENRIRSPWVFFVVPAAEIHPNKFGKGVYLKLPAEGSTTMTGYVAEPGKFTDSGKQSYTEEQVKVSNRNLKKMVEAYKTQGEEEKKTPETKQPERTPEERKQPERWQPERRQTERRPSWNAR